MCRFDYISKSVFIFCSVYQLFYFKLEGGKRLAELFSIVQFEAIVIHRLLSSDFLRVSDHVPVKLSEIRSGLASFKVFRNSSITQPIEVYKVHILDCTCRPLVSFSQPVANQRHDVVRFWCILFGVHSQIVDRLLDIVATESINVIIVWSGKIAEDR